jgi:hypothetical protein
MQQIDNKKVIHGQIREIICNTFDYMRITFPLINNLEIKNVVTQSRTGFVFIFLYYS